MSGRQGSRASGRLEGGEEEEDVGAYAVPHTPDLSDAEGESFGGPRGPAAAAFVRNRDGCHTLSNKGDSKKNDAGPERPRSPRSPFGAEHMTMVDCAGGNGAFGSYDRHRTAPECLEPYRYICKSPGKNVRSMMIDCFQKWLNIPEEGILIIKQIVGLLHNASLLIDDIEDDSKLRRGQPVAHQVYGVPQTLNCANYVYFLAMEKTLSLRNTRALEVFTSELLNLHRGQGRELFWRDNSRAPSEKEYEGMVKDKTGGLFRLGVGLMQAFATTARDIDFTKLVDLLAVYFQVRDDLINLASDEYHKNKSFCEDLSEGKYSFPILHGIHNSPQGDTQVASILKQRTQNVDLKLSVVRFLREETKSFLYTKLYLDNLFAAIEQEIQAVGGSEEMTLLMQKLKKDVDECNV